MKILFVCAGKSFGKPGNVVLNQAETLKNSDIEIEFFTICGGGITGYLKSIYFLMKSIKDKAPEIIHAHYSLSGFIAGISTRKPIVVSLMGSEMSSSFFLNFLIHIYSFLFWDKVIVKSHEMKIRLKLKNAEVIPNGVNLSKFYPIDKEFAKKKLGLKSGEKNILFLADPKRFEKNYALAKQAVDLFKGSAKLNVLYNISPEEVCWYINASDVIILTSFWEGSPNIIKEAMACNAKIVSVDVGDVKYNLKDVKSCYISAADPNDLFEKIKLAIENNDIPNGREKIIELELDSKTISEKLKNLYKLLLKQK